MRSTESDGIFVPAGGTAAVFGIRGSLKMAGSVDRPSLQFRVARVVKVSQLNNSTEY
jgi:hypothetical protein